jgi:hypothetical protein
MPYETWTFLYRDDIEAFEQHMLSAMEDAVDDMPYMTDVRVDDVPHLMRDIRHWLYLNSSSSLRSPEA